MVPTTAVAQDVVTERSAAVILDLMIRLGCGLRGQEALARAKHVGSDSRSVKTGFIGADCQLDGRRRIEGRRGRCPTPYVVEKFHVPQADTVGKPAGREVESLLQGGASDDRQRFSAGA